MADNVDTKPGKFIESIRTVDGRAAVLPSSARTLANGSTILAE